MIGSSPAKFIPGTQVLHCKSRDNVLLKKGDIVYLLGTSTAPGFKLETYTITDLLADSRIKIEMVGEPPHQKTSQVLPASRVHVDIIAHIKSVLAELEWQTTVELPNKISSLKAIIMKLNPDSNLELQVGDGTTNMEI